MGNLLYGANKWAMLRIFWIEATCFLVVFFIFFVNILINIIFWSAWSVFGIITMISMPIYLKDKHQRAAEKKEFHDSTVLWSKFDWDEFFFGFTKIVEITPDWEDKTLKEFQESRDFSIYLQKYLTRTLIKDFHAKRMAFKEVQQYINQIRAGKVEDKLLDKLMDEGIAEVNEKKKADIAKAKKTDAFELKDLPYTYLNFDDVEINKEYLKTCHIYMGLLYEEECRKGHSIPFDRCAIISELPKEIALETHPMGADDKDGYPIDVKGVKCCYLCVGFILDIVPVFYLHWSNNMTVRLKDKLRGPDVKYLNVKVLEEIVYHRSEDGEQSQHKIQRLETQKSAVTEELSDTIQYAWSDYEWGFQNRTGKQQQLLNKAQMKAAKWKGVAVVIAVIAIFIILVLGLGFLNIGDISTIPPPT